MAKRIKKTFKSVDTISKELDLVDNFVLKHWKRYSILGLIIVIGLGVVLFIYESRHASNLQVSEDVLSASTIPELNEVIKTYPNYALVDFARLHLGAKLFDNKQYEEAINVYDNEIKDATSKYSAGVGSLNRAYIFESLKKNSEAAEQFKALANNSEYPALIRCQASYSAGRIFNTLGDTKQAISMLEICAAGKNKCQFWPEIAEKMLNRINN